MRNQVELVAKVRFKKKTKTKLNKILMLKTKIILKIKANNKKTRNSKSCKRNKITKIIKAFLIVIVKRIQHLLSRRKKIELIHHHHNLVKQSNKVRTTKRIETLLNFWLKKLQLYKLQPNKNVPLKLPKYYTIEQTGIMIRDAKLET